LLREKGYESEVIPDDSGAYGVTIGKYTIDEASVAKGRAVESGAARSDAHFKKQERVVGAIRRQ
jgi:hypothetical protein